MNGSKHAALFLSRWIFWVWNVIFVVFMTFGLAPTVLLHLIAGAARGVVAPDFVFYSIVLVMIPPLSIVLAMKRLKDDPLALIRYFYGVEAPLLALCVFRLFLFRELTPGTMQLGFAAALGAGAYFVTLVRKKDAAPLGLAKDTGLLALSTLYALAGCYAAGLFSFFVPPLADVLGEMVGELPNALRHFSRTVGLYDMFLVGVGTPFMFLTMTVALGGPLGLILISLGGWLKTQRAYAKSHGYAPLAGVTGAAIAVNMMLFSVLNRQPQQEAFELLSHPPKTAGERLAMLAKSDGIRAGLVNAYLSPYRYLATNEEATGLNDLYEKRLKFAPASARKVQDAFNGLARPFLYDGKSVMEDARKAELLYEDYFDVAIQEGEREAINHALASTYDRSEDEAGLLDKDAEVVRIEAQDLTVEERGDYAMVELHEAYQNQTGRQAEVLYHFALPESAVVTGLWLGDTDDKRKRFPFAVAAKGAAQSTYRGEMRRRQDPALLEQVGPGSYRLRAYPVPARTVDAKTGDSPELHLWLTYEVMAKDGAWPLPELIEKRNAYIDDTTTLTLNGKAMRRHHGAWLPEGLKAAQPQAAPKRRVVAVGDYTVTAVPLKQAGAGQPLRGANVAVVIDRSRSMAGHTKEVLAAMHALRGRAQNEGFKLTTIVTGYETKELTATGDPTAEELLAWGSTAPLAALAQVQALAATKKLTAVILLTDANGFDRRNDAQDALVLPWPVWIVHLGRELPKAYDDKLLLPLLASGGGATRDVETVLARMGLPEQLVDDTYAWTIDQHPGALAVNAQGFLPFAAAHLIRDALGKGAQREHYEALHAVAQKTSVVSPVSSMIVLVNDQQRQALAAAEAQANKFDTTQETGKELLTTPFGTVSATPEPEEWLLMAMAGMALAAVYWQKRNKMVFARATPRL